MKPPTVAPMIWNTMYSTVRGNVARRAQNVEMVTRGLICPPEIGAVAKMKSGRMMAVLMAATMTGKTTPRLVVLFGES